MPAAVARRSGQIERRHPEHCAGAFGIARGDQRRVQIEEVSFLVEAVDGKGERVADAGNGAEGVGARPEMGDLPEPLERRALLL